MFKPTDTPPLIWLKIHPFRGASARAGTFVAADASFKASILSLAGRPMDTVAAYSISAFIVGFGIGIFIAGLNSDAPALWACVALIPVVIGLLSAFGAK